MSEQTYGILGSSTTIKELRAKVSRLVQYDDSTVSAIHICGESGTGKELVARAIHREGSRGSKPFQAFNCAGLTETLASSELFGHELGAFTGAVNEKKGFFEVANGGVIFLDEVADMPIRVQPTLLRALEEREVIRVGGSKPQKVDVQVISASSKPLLEEVKFGKFRRDLNYRLSQIRLEVPPLRERKGDVEILARYFIRNICSERRVEMPYGLSEEALGVLNSYSWPGNVRELKNVIGAATVFLEGNHIGQEDIEKQLESSRQSGDAAEIVDQRFQVDGLSMPENRKALEKYLISRALNATGNNKSAAAKLLQVNRSGLFRKIAEYRIE